MNALAPPLKDTTKSFVSFICLDADDELILSIFSLRVWKNMNITKTQQRVLTLLYSTQRFISQLYYHF